MKNLFTTVNYGVMNFWIKYQIDIVRILTS